MASSYFTSSLRQIRRFVPRDEPAVSPNKIARRFGGGKKQCQGSPFGFPNTYPPKYWMITNKRMTNRSILFGQGGCGACGVKPWRRPAQTPCADDDI